MITSRAKRSGMVAACARPIGPPQSWQTRVISVRSSPVISVVRIPVWRAMVYQWMSVGLSERPKPMWSGAIQRKPAATSTGMRSRYRYDQVGMPWSNNMTGASRGPSST